MRLSTCGCRAEHYRRAPRAWWMKLLGSRRLYHCYACDAVLLVPPQALAQKRHIAAAHPAAAVTLRAS